MRLIFLVSLFLISCSGKEDILSPARMQGVMWDYVQADVYSYEFLKKDSLINADSSHMVLLTSIFDRHKISKKDFFRSYDFYLSHPDQLNPILDSIIAKQNRSVLKNIKTKKPRL